MAPCWKGPLPGTCPRRAELTPRAVRFRLDPPPGTGAFRRHQPRVLRWHGQGPTRRARERGGDQPQPVRTARPYAAAPAALPEEPPVIVVDNASTDGTEQIVRSRRPEVAVLTSATNLGAAVPQRRRGAAGVRPGPGRMAAESRTRRCCPLSRLPASRHAAAPPVRHPRHTVVHLDSAALVQCHHSDDPAAVPAAT
jgi:hypothetical protein